MVVCEFVLGGCAFSRFFFSIVALQVAGHNHPSHAMINDAQAMVGRFYKFKPRSDWPKSTRNSIPADKMYESHPVMVVSISKAGALNVVMLTSHPIQPISNYVPIGFESDRVPIAPLMFRTKALPKQSWLQLNSKRTYPKELFMRFENARLGKASMKRLGGLVTQIDNRSKQPVLAEKSIASPPKPAATTAVVHSLALNVEPKHPEVQEIKTSLAKLARAVTALAAVCNKLEAGATLSPQAAQPLAKLVTKTSCMPTEMSGAVPAEVTKNSEVVTLKAVQSKRSRIGKWLAGFFKAKKTTALRT